MMLRRWSSLPHLLAAALLVVAAFQALADTLPVPALTGRVVDQANILSGADENRLTSKLSHLETKTSIQLIVVTLASLQDQPIEDWGLTLGRTWGIGQKGKDNGALLIVAPNDRELRIEVGYGLEGTLPDATADAIIRNVIIPRFKAGDMAGGISDGIDAIIAMLTGTGEEFTPSRRELVGQALSEWAPVLFVALFIVLMIVAQFRGRRRRGRYYRNRRGGWLFVDDYDSHWGGRGFGGRGSGGGFSGGGGSFGGGGASGRW
ncbi:TPM domain-containing protein [Dongia deserti]|uniref:TPM domain-containing protein n=1 Tax=Dongia deserti TaxID=2268030 RepID=UPI002549475B|nr:TPM domain-containing protein [Dongia deserti]